MSILVVKDDKAIKKFEIEDFREMSFQEKYEIYLEKVKFKADLFCDCNGKIPLTFYYRQAYDEDIFIKNLGRKGDQHLTSCKLHSHFVESIYELGCEKTEQGDILINLSANAIKQKQRMDREKYNKDDRYGNVENITEKSITKAKVTLFGLTSKLLLMSWHKYILKEKCVPELLKQYIRKCYGVARGFLIAPDTSLQDVWYGGKTKFETLKEGEYQYILMSVISIAAHQKLKDSYSLCLYDYYEKKPVWVTAPKFMVNDALFKINHTIEDCQYLKKEEGSIYRMLAAGFVVNNKGYMVCASLCLVPIIPNGLWYENEFEYLAYQKLVSEKRLFHKAYTSLSIYNNDVPTFYIDDCEKKVIGEVFPPQYNPTKKIKRINCGKKATANDFWYWDTSVTRRVPVFPVKQKVYPFEVEVIGDDKVAIIFNYDKEIILKIKSLKGTWNGAAKRWEIDKEKLGAFKQLF